MGRIFRPSLGREVELPAFSHGYPRELASRGVEAGSAVEELRQVLLATLIDYPLSVDHVRRHFSVN
jgi:hypothetical protein